MLKDSVVIAGPASEQLAFNIAKRLNIKFIKPELRIFADGESKIKLESVENNQCIIIQSLYPPIDRHIIQLLMMIQKCRRDKALKTIVVIPYMAYARQDKAFLEGEVISISILAEIIECFGVSRVITVDIHSQSSLSYFGNIIKNISAIPILAEYALQNIFLNNAIIISPDFGGLKRAQKFGEIIQREVTFLKKTRDRLTGMVSIEDVLDFKVKDKDVILVDDMISTGNSIIKACEVLRNNGAESIFVICSHALLLDKALDKIIRAGATEIISTNSIPNSCSKVDLSKIISEVISENS
ncbi:MAG TPA: ribose-phosphate pyrophosphokinase [Nitrososphaeraceae archaeon]|nr:ribose-phosphate pyrophosphokinase [Nitrososphaeraceae archaeon]